MARDKWLETKVGKRKWRFKYTEVLRRKPRKLKGRVIANQYAHKRNANTYDLVLKGRRY